MLSLLAFNIGIEMGQILVIAAILPPLALLSRRPAASRHASLVLCTMAGFVAWLWLVERAEMLATMPWPPIDFAMAAARVLSAVLILGGLAFWLMGRRAR